ncbi:BTAD domain-containing putative transcriptional regulator [Streptomyces sp. NPDC046887]|uniref:AfsR/SARP family transcriptional regulator n=1 Tax=Streptomyces sp. NPDC046887 TaxID=3155472 RepID=UPI0033CF22E7
MRPPQTAALLAALLLRHGRSGSTTTLIDAVWGGAVPHGAPAALRGHVARLRRLLEPGRPPRTAARVLVTRPGGYALRLLPDALDLTVFERHIGGAERALRAGRLGDALTLYGTALDLWSGEPLAGVPGPFAAAQRSLLRERWLAAVEARCAVQLRLGAHGPALEQLRTLAPSHLRRERTQELLVTALYESGRQTEALDVYHRTRHALLQAGGSGPGPALERARERILAGPGVGDGADTLRPDAPGHPGSEACPGPTGTRLGPAGTHSAAPGSHPAATPAEAGPVRETAGRSPETGASADGDARRTPARTVPVPVPAALRLPPPPADLVGRDAVAARLTRALVDGTVTALGAVSGMGGVGKTALAVGVAHAVRDHYPDGILHLDLRGMEARPADPHQVLRELLRAQGVAAAHLPAATAERAALHRSLLADRRMLLVLDNARDAEHVRDLLPAGPRCGALVTSRARLSGLGGAALVHLEELAEGPALELLARIAGPERIRAEEAAAREVVAGCGGLPLALRVVAARLAARPGLPVAETARALADERLRLSELDDGAAAVESTFRLGTALLGPEQLRAFRLLSVPQVPVLSRQSAAVLLERSEAVAEGLCEELVDASLLQSPAPGRYGYHDLLRLFARSPDADGSAGERAAALLRLLRRCAALARDAYRLATAGDAFPADDPAETAPGPGAGAPPVDRAAAQEAAAGWLLDERAAHLALVEQGAETPGVPVSLCARLLVATDPLGRDSSRSRALERAARAVRTAADRAGDPVAWAIASYMLGGSFAMRFEMGSAVPLLRGAAEVFRREGRGALLAHALNALGGCALAHRDFAAALRHLGEALELARETESPACEAVALGYLGIALLATGRAAEAVRTARAAVALARSCGDGAGEANALRALGQVLLHTGRHQEALRCLHGSLDLWRGTGSSFREALVLGGLAEAYNLAGRPEEALEHAARGRELATRHGDDYLLGRILTEFGNAVGARGRPEQAAFYHRQALRIFRRLGMPEAGDLEARLGP